MKQRLLLLFLCACVLACDSANPVAPAGAVLSMTANPSQITLTGESTITVTGFKPDANPLNPGTQIIVSTSLGNLFHPTTGAPVSIVEIDGNGRATVILRADGRAGSATVTATLATSGGGGGAGGGDGDGGGTTPSVGASASTTVQVGASEGDRPTLIISANPSTIAVRALSRISLLGRNSDNTPVSAGQRIRLTADLGELVADGGNANSPRIDSVLTDSNGEAFATFVAGDRGGEGTVSAILGTGDEVSVSISIRDAIDSLFLSGSKNTVNRIETGDTIIFTATLQDAQGEPVSGTVVNFVAERGTFNDNAVPSNSQGEAQATLTVRRDDIQDIPENGTFNVTATATSEGNTRTATVEITVLGAP